MSGDPVARYLHRLDSAQRQIAARRLTRVADLLGTSRAGFIPHELGAEGIVRVRDKMIAQGSSPSAINSALEMLRAVTRVAFESGRVSEEELTAVEAVSSVPDTGSRQRLLTGQELSAVAAVSLQEGTAKGARDAAILLTLYAGGLSAKELVGLSLDSWHGQKALLRVRSEGWGGRPVPFGKDAHHVLRRWLSLRGPRPGSLFLPLDEADRVCGDRLHVAAIAGLLNKRTKQAQVDRFSCKDLRVTAAAAMRRAGAEDRELGSILGYPVPRVTASSDGKDTQGPEIRAVQLASEHVDYFDLIGAPGVRSAGSWSVSEEASLASGWIDTSGIRPVPRLGSRVTTSAGEMAYGTVGEGPPVVLVHGGAGRAVFWRGVAPRLAQSHTVYALDLPGHGESEYREGQDLSIAVQARVLAELIGEWGMGEPGSAPDVAGEGAGAAIVLRAYLLEGVPVRRMALLNPTVFTSGITEAERHLRDHPKAYLTMPEKLFEATLRARAKEEIGTLASSDATELFVSQWRGDQGRLAYVGRAQALAEEHTAELEPLLGCVDVPVLILHGGDKEENNSPLARLKEAIPGARLGSLPWGEHLLSEEAPDDVAHALCCLFSI